VLALAGWLRGPLLLELRELLDDFLLALAPLLHLAGQRGVDARVHLHLAFGHAAGVGTSAARAGALIANHLALILGDVAALLCVHEQVLALAGWLRGPLLLELRELLDDFLLALAPLLHLAGQRGVDARVHLHLAFGHAAGVGTSTARARALIADNLERVLVRMPD